MEQIIQNNYTEAVKAIKAAILQSRYQVARFINREALTLYYAVGKYISENSRNNWGQGAISAISKQLQQELPGLRGFSETAMKRMRTFYETWMPVFSNRPSAMDEIGTAATHNIEIVPILSNNQPLINCPLTTDELSDEDLKSFLSVPFTHHYEIAIKCSDLKERLFYIEHAAKEIWSVEKLQYNLKADLYHNQGTMPNNFECTIPQDKLQQLTTKAFRDEYQLDFLTVDDPDAINEKQVEEAIVLNIRKFIMALGSDFSFMGNQYRLVVDDKEYFVDLLFFNRRLQSLVAIELKWAEFKPEHVGQLNFYLSALDDLVRLPNENPSVGVILCRGKSEKIVEYALRDTTKPMGVATYRTANELPKEYQQALAQLEKLKELM
ncbi:MAG: PDDEXK nuclease domain-containing protein [Bacteroidaceae bacterium]|nr:PDDEXK nuclease domain-containing protein [Bacteroidaceae bacterium]